MFHCSGKARLIIGSIVFCYCIGLLLVTVRFKCKLMDRMNLSASPAIPDNEKSNSERKDCNFPAHIEQTVLLTELDKLSKEDGRSEWRNHESRTLAARVQNRLRYLQNPKNCNHASKLYCNLTNGYGFASGIHDILWCFIKAYYSKRMLVLITTHWHYMYSDWELLFQPLSSTCSKEISLPRSTPWPGVNSDSNRHLISLLPKDIFEHIHNFHGNPLAWWYGQFLKYLLRPGERLLNHLNEIKTKIGFTHPIVGMHVRRTDKLNTEAKYHALEEYLLQIEDYYERLELSEKVKKRLVYLATDDPSVVKECLTKFPKITFLYVPNSAVMANHHATRYTNASFWGVLVDVLLLAETDFIVCTFSSGICRLSYELMQSMHVDASMKAHSLDVGYSYAWAESPPRLAIYNNIPRSSGEMWLKKGDIIRQMTEKEIIYQAVQGKHWDGFFKGFNKRTGRYSIYPAYKTIEQVQVAEQEPDYSTADQMLEVI